MSVMDLSETYLKPAEVGKIFRVDPKTVMRWAQSGRLECIRTPGGHRRYLASAVQAILDAGKSRTPRSPGKSGSSVTMDR